jgi:hypothetical protein
MDGIGGEAAVLELDDVALDLVGGEILKRLGAAPGEVGVQLLLVPAQGPRAAPHDLEVQHPLPGQVL